ncbi:hypothetical protein quinque_007401 [Culex quinquefasciatus]
MSILSRKKKWDKMRNTLANQRWSVEVPADGTHAEVTSAGLGGVTSLKFADKLRWMLGQADGINCCTAGLAAAGSTAYSYNIMRSSSFCMMLWL